MRTHFCIRHARIYQPASATTVPPYPAHWRPLAGWILAAALSLARQGGCAVDVQVTACDVCGQEAATPLRGAGARRRGAGARG